MNKITEVPEEISGQWPVISGQFQDVERFCRPLTPDP